jgi:hypothetical protein
MMPKSNWVLLASLMAAAPAFAAPPDDAAAPPMVAADRPVATPVDEIDGAAGMRDGSFLPLTVAARIGEQRVMGVALGGYDTTGGGAGGARFESVVEGALAGRFALRVGVEYAPPDAQWSPSVGARVAILRQERFGVDLSMAALYKKAGFSEPDGEIEIIVMLARRWNRFGLFGNLAYGQGLQAAERDGEVRVALLYQLTRRFHLGLDARGRLDLGSGV